VSTATVQTYTLGDLARRYGLPTWKVRRLFERGLLEEPGRAGMYRVVTEADLPAVEEALVRAGYIDAAQTHAAS
jgi:hypothetical protein